MKLLFILRGAEHRFRDQRECCTLEVVNDEHTVLDGKAQLQEMLGGAPPCSQRWVIVALMADENAAPDPTLYLANTMKLVDIWDMAKRPRRDDVIIFVYLGLECLPSDRYDVGMGTKFSGATGPLLGACGHPFSEDNLHVVEKAPDVDGTMRRVAECPHCLMAFPTKMALQSITVDGEPLPCKVLVDTKEVVRVPDAFVMSQGDRCAVEGCDAVGSIQCKACPIAMYCQGHFDEHTRGIMVAAERHRHVAAEGPRLPTCRLHADQIAEGFCSHVGILLCRRCGFDRTLLQDHSQCILEHECVSGEPLTSDSRCMDAAMKSISSRGAEESRQQNSIMALHRDLCAAKARNNVAYVNTVKELRKHRDAMIEVVQKQCRDAEAKAVAEFERQNESLSALLRDLEDRMSCARNELLLLDHQRRTHPLQALTYPRPSPASSNSRVTELSTRVSGAVGCTLTANLRGIDGALVDVLSYRFRGDFVGTIPMDCGVFGVAALPDGNVLVCGGDQVACVHVKSQVVSWKLERKGSNFRCVNLVNEGTAILSDVANHKLCVLNLSDRTITREIGRGRGPGAHQFNTPRDVISLSAAIIAVADSGNHRVKVLNYDTGEVIRCIGKGQGNLRSQSNEPWGSNQLNGPRGLALLPNNTLAVADSGNHRVMIVDPYKDNTFIQCIGSPGSGPLQFCNPMGLQTLPNGMLAVVDTDNDRLQVIDRDGQFTFQLGNGRGNGENQFHRPRSIAITGDAKLVVADTANRRLQILE